jgi:SpoVK/Ycf46/Vps4 family AAA+-type ATPase
LFIFVNQLSTIMNQELLIRLFRVIEGGKNDDIVKIAEQIVDDEKKKGHDKLAERLAIILKRNINTIENFRGELKQMLPKGVAIPTDKRYNLPLAIYKERDELRHHMVLSKEVEEKISRVEREYSARERLAHHGLTYRQKILIYGPPGCGKSMSAERIAWNLGLPFLRVRFDVIISSYLGETASNLAKLFDGIKSFPCVLLFDEFDVIAKTRGGNSQDVGEMHRVVNILLSLLEEFTAPGIFIATTNLETTLDNALFRRFDDIIEIPKPGKEEAERLLRQSLSSMPKKDNINWGYFIEKLEGLSAAVIVKIANDAAKFAVIHRDGLLDHVDLERSFNENDFYAR